MLSPAFSGFGAQSTTHFPSTKKLPVTTPKLILCASALRSVVFLDEYQQQTTSVEIPISLPCARCTHHCRKATRLDVAIDVLQQHPLATFVRNSVIHILPGKD